MIKSENKRLLDFITAPQHTSTYFAKWDKISPSSLIRNSIFALYLSSVSFSFSVSAEPSNLTLAINEANSTQNDFEAHNNEIQLNNKPKRANFQQETASHDTQYLADWIIDSNNNDHMPFVIIDKKQAKVFVFDSDGKLHGAAPALLGLAVGDTSIPDIGNMALANIKPEQRTTPAGRFVAALGQNIHNKEVLWVNYDGAISLHRVVTSSPKERRLQRLASQNPLERRISYGCINVPVNFYDKVISPTFTGTNGIVYVLPDTRQVQEVFGSYSVGDHAIKHLQEDRLPQK